MHAYMMLPALSIMSSAQEEDQAVWAQVKRKEEQRLQREKAIFSRQSQVLLRLPAKREKAEVCWLPRP